MFSSRKRPFGFEQQLVACLNNQYAIGAKSVEQAPRGFYGETWKVYGIEGLYLAKLICHPPQEAVFKKSFAVIAYMRKNGIDFISEPISTRKGKYTVSFAGGTLALFAFVPGEHTEEYPLEDLFARLKQIYRLPLPDFEVDTEDFAADTPEKLRGSIAAVQNLEESIAKEAIALIAKNKDIMRHYESRLYAIAEVVRGDKQGFCITSGDVGGNVIIEGDRFTIIDWDHIVVAPKERDLWFYMQKPSQIALINNCLAPLPMLEETRLAYYAYRQYFFYIREYLVAFLECPWARVSIVLQLKRYFESDYFVSLCMQQAEKLIIK